MKKLLIPVLMLSAFFAAQTAFATDVCSNEPRQSADFYVENHRVNWLLSMSCVDSEILTTMPVGSVMHVIGKTEGWHKLVTEDGQIGWMWEDYVQPTTKPFNPKSNEPEPQPEPEPVEYVAMRDISGHKYEDAIWYVFNNGIVRGYEDGSYKPDQNINRAELLKIIVESYYNQTEIEAFEGKNCFTDVKADQWYSKYVCFAQSKDIIEGYEDGSFKPSNEVNFVEALKIVLYGQSINQAIPNAEPGSPWYKKFVDFASVRDYIPLDVDEFNDMFNRGQMADMITRILKDNFDSDELAEYLGENPPRITYEMLES